MLQLYLIRHGQSTNNLILDERNDDYVAERTPDPELTDVGYQQAELVAEALAKPFTFCEFDPQNRAGFGLTHLYCSLMSRAVKTGLAIAQRTGLQLVAWTELHETGGLFDVDLVDGERVFIGQPGPGRSYFETHFPQLILPEELTENGWYQGGLEPHSAYTLRARKIFERVLAEHGDTDHRVGLVIHAGIFTHLMTALFKVQADDYWFSMNNCSISRVDIYPEGRVKLKYMNKVDHFPDHLIT